MAFHIRTQDGEAVARLLPVELCVNFQQNSIILQEIRPPSGWHHRCCNARAMSGISKVNNQEKTISYMVRLKYKCSIILLTLRTNLNKINCYTAEFLEYIIFVVLAFHIRTQDGEAVARLLPVELCVNFQQNSISLQEIRPPSGWHHRCCNARAMSGISKVNNKEKTISYMVRLKYKFSIILLMLRTNLNKINCYTAEFLEYILFVVLAFHIRTQDGEAVARLLPVEPLCE
ncbi:MAG: hypothetical protein ACJ71U_02810 [Terriglobales bacterium]